MLALKKAINGKTFSAFDRAFSRLLTPRKEDMSSLKNHLVFLMLELYVEIVLHENTSSLLALSAISM